MKKILLFLICLVVFLFTFFNRYTFVSLDLKKPSTKEVEIREITAEGEKVVKKEVEILLRYFKIGKEPEVYVEPEDVKIERLKCEILQNLNLGI